MSRSRCTLRVRGLDCSHEAAVLRQALEGDPGIQRLGFDLIHGTLTVEYEPRQTGPEALVRVIAERTGMHAEPAVAPEADEVGGGTITPRQIATMVAGLALGAGQAISWLGLPGGLEAGWSRWAATACHGVAVVLGSAWLIPRAWSSLRRVRLDIAVLMVVAILGAIGLGRWDEAATVAFLFGVSEWLEALSLDCARRAIRRLLEITPQTAERIEPDGSIQRLPATAVRAGDRILVRTGETIPVDGTIVEGRSSLDQKAITGESVPVDCGPGDAVFAGTINGEGTLEIQAAGPVGDALIARIVDQVRAAQAGRAAVERRIDRFAQFYTPAVILLALLVMVVPPLVGGSFAAAGGDSSGRWQEWFYNGLVVLVIACPCALVIATPVAVVSGLAAAARGGVLIKGGEFLEEVGRLRALAFDKTGTLTLGQPDVVEVVSASEAADEERVLRIAAALGDRGGHLLGKAIARHARNRRLEVPVADDYRAIPGMGALGRVEAVEYHLGSHRYIDEAGLCHPEFHCRLGAAEAAVGTAVALTARSGPLGWIRLADRPRPEAPHVLEELRRLGLATIMLTGDNAQTAAAVADQLGVAEQRAELLPADKVQAITELNARLGPTGMVGDGVNDAPALAAARVSIALGGISSGAALETADIVLMAEDLTRLPWLVRHSRATLARIHQNIALALGTKALVLGLAVFGLANLWMAIAADVGTTLVVVLNALRLLGRDRVESGPGARLTELPGSGVPPVTS